MPDIAVVFVHGLWMTGVDMTLLRQRFKGSGYATYQFGYSSTRISPQQAAEELTKFVDMIVAKTVHFVCHSLGGLVIRHFFHEFANQRSGRVVTLGTPHQSSSAAQQLGRFRCGRFVMGKSLVRGLLGGVPAWDSGRDLGVIAGTLNFGPGRLILSLGKPNDGVVEVSETHLPTMKEHTELRVSHVGLLFSKQVFKQTAYFLDHGQFMG